MKNLGKDKLNFIKKLIGLCSAVLCFLMFLFNFIDYTSTTTLSSGGNITGSGGVSMFSFLFNENKDVFDGTVGILRDVFTYSYVIMWISFILVAASIIVLGIGFIYKKTLISKIGSGVLAGGVVLLITMIFDTYKIGNTVRYLNVFTWIYVLMLFICVMGLLSIFTIDDK